MTKRDKLIARFVSLPTEVDFDELCQLLDMFGYLPRKGGSGSHRVFVGPNGEQFTVPLVSGRKVKRHYVRSIVQLLDLESYVER